MQHPRSIPILRRWPWLVLRCLLDMIDHQDLDRSLRRLQPQPKLILKSRKNRGPGGFRSGRPALVPLAMILKLRKLTLLGSPLQFDVVTPRNAGMIVNIAADHARQAVGQLFMLAPVRFICPRPMRNWPLRWSPFSFPSSGNGLIFSPP